MPKTEHFLSEASQMSESTVPPSETIPEHRSFSRQWDEAQVKIPLPNVPIHHSIALEIAMSFIHNKPHALVIPLVKHMRDQGKTWADVARMLSEKSGGHQYAPDRTEQVFGEKNPIEEQGIVPLRTEARRPDDPIIGETPVIVPPVQQSPPVSETPVQATPAPDLPEPKPDVTVRSVVIDPPVKHVLPENVGFTKGIESDEKQGPANIPQPPSPKGIQQPAEELMASTQPPVTMTHEQEYAAQGSKIAELMAAIQEKQKPVPLRFAGHGTLLRDLRQVPEFKEEQTLPTPVPSIQTPPQSMDSPPQNVPTPLIQPQTPIHSMVPHPLHGTNVPLPTAYSKAMQKLAAKPKHLGDGTVLPPEVKTEQQWTDDWEQVVAQHQKAHPDEVLSERRTFEDPETEHEPLVLETDTPESKVQFFGPEFSEVQERDPEKAFEPTRRRSPSPEKEQEIISAPMDYARELGDFIQGRLSTRYQSLYPHIDISKKQQIIARAMNRVWEDSRKLGEFSNLVELLSTRQIELPEAKQRMEAHYIKDLTLMADSMLHHAVKKGWVKDEEPPVFKKTKRKWTEPDKLLEHAKTKSIEAWEKIMKSDERRNKRATKKLKELDFELARFQRSKSTVALSMSQKMLIWTILGKIRNTGNITRAQGKELGKILNPYTDEIKTRDAMYSSRSIEVPKYELAKRSFTFVVGDTQTTIPHHVPLYDLYRVQQFLDPQSVEGNTEKFKKIVHDQDRLKAEIQDRSDTIADYKLMIDALEKRGSGFRKSKVTAWFNKSKTKKTPKKRKPRKAKKPDTPKARSPSPMKVQKTPVPIAPAFRNTGARVVNVHKRRFGSRTRKLL